MKIREIITSSNQWQDLVITASNHDVGIIQRVLSCENQDGLQCTIDDVFITFVNIINLGLQFVGVIMFILLIYTGYLFLYASLTGNQQYYSKGKNYIGSIWWGFVIIVTSYIVVNTIMGQILDINTWTQPWGS